MKWFTWLRKRLDSCKLMFNNLAKLTKNIKCNRFCFISVGIQVILRLIFFEELPCNKFVNKKKYLKKYFVAAKLFRITMFSWWFSWFFRILNFYQIFFTVGIVFDEVDKELGHERHFVRYHLYFFSPFILYFLKYKGWTKQITSYYTCRE